MPKGINWNEQFYKLLRLSLGLTQEFPVDVLTRCLTLCEAGMLKPLDFHIPIGSKKINDLLIFGLLYSSGQPDEF